MNRAYPEWPITVIYEALEEGQGLSRTQAEDLEAELELQPDRLDLRIQIIGYSMPRHFRDKSVAKKRARHILWLISHLPDHPVLAEPEAQIQNIDEEYEAAKTLLMAKLEQDPDNIQLIWNVALSVLVEDDTRSEQLLLHGQQLKPNDPGWSLMLSVIYGLRAKHGEEEQKAEWRACERQAKKLCSELRQQRDSLESDSEQWYL
ncbi:MAG: hypothetical protein P4L53_08685 [Candidatus Obscuribacterales bacterium]|nr:hypothetical protein [Candidatus Obscuribacterales bacterium]